ncbi:MAG: metal ABC transporter ATP-binding protein, partial [Acidimicrobiia bacterium]|nr:metal ABC transporter ATP-binding protein [Acidimicrobiia bacterium]
MTDLAVEASDLELGYGAGLVLAASSFVVPMGGITAVIGPNGSGKSTLLNAIAGLIEPLAGHLRVPAHAKGLHRISYVLQSTKVSDHLPISVGEVVAMGRYAHLGPLGRLGQKDRDAIADAMERTGIVAIRDRQIQELSGGQRQRAFVAQGLAQEHDLLLLDEPLSAVDITTAHAIDEVIHEEKQRGCTVILTTHDLSEASVADHVLLLAGRVIASGPPHEVLTGPNLAAA